MKKLPNLVAASLFLAVPAHAHDVWANGEPVPAWVKRACCGPEDAHHLAESQVHARPDGGWDVDGYRGVVPRGSELPSPDGSFWIFYADKPDGSQTPVYCFFAPFNGT